MKKDTALALIKFITVFILILGVFFLGVWFGKQQEVKPIIRTSNYSLNIEMDKSCYEQFQNNIDKTIYVKLNFR